MFYFLYHSSFRAMYIDVKQCDKPSLRFCRKPCNNFENLKENLFSTDIFTDKASDINFYNEKLQEELHSEYYSVEEINKVSEKLIKEAFSIFHLNIRSLNKNIDKLKDLLGFLKGKFSVIVLTEIWADETAKNNSLFRIPKDVALHQTRNGQRGVGICFLILK